MACPTLRDSKAKEKNFMKLYVGTYHKYNCGSIFGEWVDLDDFSSKEEFLEKCHEIHKDEEDPELMFQDFEADSDWEGEFYSESYISADYWTFKDSIPSYIDDDDLKAILEFNSDNDQYPLDGDFFREFEDNHGFSKITASTVDSAYQEYLDEIGLLSEIPERYRNYINFESLMEDDESNGEITHIKGNRYDKHYFFY